MVYAFRLKTKRIREFLTRMITFSAHIQMNDSRRNYKFILFKRRDHLKKLHPVLNNLHEGITLQEEAVKQSYRFWM